MSQAADPAFRCPKCGGSDFGRDTAADGKGGVAVLGTVRCHAPGCGWRGEWPPARKLNAAQLACLRQAASQCDGTVLAIGL